MSAQSDIHSCSYYCDRPECIKAQRDELRERQLSAQGAGLADEAISVADIEKEISHIQQNGINLAKFGGEEVHEGRCRELCAMYLREFVIAHRMMGKLASLRAHAAGDAPAPSSKGWAIKGPDGTLLNNSVARAEDIAWTRAQAWYGKWKFEFVHEGYTCVPVTITEDGR